MYIPVYIYVRPPATFATIRLPHLDHHRTDFTSHFARPDATRAEIGHKPTRSSQFVHPGPSRGDVASTAEAARTAVPHATDARGRDPLAKETCPRTVVTSSRGPGPETVCPRVTRCTQTNPQTTSRAPPTAVGQASAASSATLDPAIWTSPAVFGSRLQTPPPAKHPVGQLARTTSTLAARNFFRKRNSSHCRSPPASPSLRAMNH